MGDFLYYCTLTVHSFCTTGARWGGRILLKWPGSFLSSKRFSPSSREVQSSFFPASFERHTLRLIPIDIITWSSASRWAVFLSDGGLFLLSAWFGERLHTIWFKLCFTFSNNCMIWVFSDNNTITQPNPQPCIIIEWFSVECRKTKTKTKVITLANHKKHT